MNNPTNPELTYDAMVLREPFSGVEVAVYELACALARLSPANLRIHFPSAIGRERPAGPNSQWEPHPIPFQSRLLRILWQQTALPALLAKGKPCLLHAPAYVAPLRLNCPLVLTLYDLHVYSHPETCRRPNLLHYRMVMPSSIRRAAAIIVPSQNTLNALRGRFGEKVAGKTTVIPLGVAGRFRPVSKQNKLAGLRRKYGLPRDFVLFVGNLAPRKNLPLLLDAMREVNHTYPGLGLVLVGKGSPPSGMTGADNAILPGYVPEADLPALYSDAMALVFPSVDEGYGLPVLEAMACGCPVVCGGGVPREIAPGQALTSTSDPVALAGSIRSLYENPDMRASLSAGGRKIAQARSWEAAAGQTWSVYRRLLPSLGFMPSGNPSPRVPQPIQ